MLKLKGFLLTTTLMLFSAAGICSNEFYIGLGAGPNHANFKQRAFFSRVSAFDVSNVRVIEKDHFAGKGYFFSVFAGAGLRCSLCNADCEDGYLGLELNADYRRIKFRTSNDEFIHLNFQRNIYKMKQDYGISLLPGFIFNDCSLFYGRLGYANGKFKTDVNDDTLQNLHKWRSGFRYGLGFRQSLSECFAFRIDYSQTTYKKSKMFFSLPSQNLGKTTTVTPYTQRFELGVMYIF